MNQVLGVLHRLEEEDIQLHVILLLIKDGLRPRPTLGISRDRRHRNGEESSLDLLQMIIDGENDMCPVLRHLGHQVQAETGTNKRNGAVKSQDMTRRTAKEGRRTSTPSPISVHMMSISQGQETVHLPQVEGGHGLRRVLLHDGH